MKSLHEIFFRAMDFLPSFERDLFILYYLSGFSQSELAAIFKVSQPTVCYRISKGWERIKFYSNRPSFRDSDLLSLFEESLSKEDSKYCLWYVKFTSQSAVAQKFGVSQGKVRHRIMRSVQVLEKEGKDFLVSLLNASSENLNIGREIKRQSS